MRLNVAFVYHVRRLEHGQDIAFVPRYKHSGFSATVTAVVGYWQDRKENQSERSSFEAFTSVKTTRSGGKAIIQAQFLCARALVAK